MADHWQIMESVLYEFPVAMVEFFIPKWVEMLEDSHPVKKDTIHQIRTLINRIDTISDIAEHPISMTNDHIRRCVVEKINMSDGSIRVILDYDEKTYYEMISELTDETVENENQVF